MGRDLRQLVLLRNEAATKLGFKDFHAMRLYLSEQDQAQVLKLFDELDALTREPFAQAKAEIDVSLARYCGIPIDELQPWHYQDPFFQEAPAVSDVSLDKVFSGVEHPGDLPSKFYDGIGLPIDDVIERSDLYEKPGKSPHAFCTDIDRVGDVRVLANIVPNEYWMGTMLHELGHSVYQQQEHSPRPALRAPQRRAHPLHRGRGDDVRAVQQERRVARRHGRDGLRSGGLQQGRRRRCGRNQLLIFSRWCQVMLRFEQQMYANPGQNLNDLWWQLVEKYQLIKRPAGRNAPDYAAKIHVVSAPAYYHNYMMGQLFACQVHATIARDVLKDQDIPNAVYTDDKGVGKYMNEKVFAPGATLSWNELTKHATGEELNAKAFAAEFGEK